MKILHLAPLWFPVATDASGGRETVLAGLFPALAKLGCQNTVLATADSRTTAELVPVVPENMYALMRKRQAYEYSYYESHQLLLAAQLAPQFDLVHSHLGERGFALTGATPVLHTWHTPVWEDLQWFVRQHPDFWYSTVSEFQARKFRAAGATRCRVIPNGIEMTQFVPQAGGEGLAFLGRMDAGKGPDLAIAVARQLRRPLTLAGPIVDQPFFDQAVKPFLNDDIRYIGTVNQAQRQELLGAAGCAVLPFRGAEAFGMVSIEAMACGTPVVALANGALPEIVEPGVTGYLTGNEDELAGLVTQAMKLNRPRIRQRVAARFDLPIIAGQYLELYRQIVASKNKTGSRRSRPSAVRRPAAKQSTPSRPVRRAR
jgi:glycosyltransferase involved in cell wall biosynthesis